MQRREFLKAAAAIGSGAALAGSAASASHAAPHMRRPHIFVIFSDDVTAHDLGCYGNAAVRTPRLDQFAQEGMRFDNMFTATPMCAPSRASLFTGLYPFRHGAHPNWSEVKPGTKGLPHFMQALGYRVVLIGKRHFNPPECFPFEYFAGDLGKLGPEDDLERLLRDPGERPICLFYVKFGTHFHWPHNRFNYDPAQVTLAPYLVDTPETREMRANYFSSITEMDEAVGRVLDLLRETGMERDTLTIWTADHGTMWPHERENIYDAGLRTPFIARWPGVIEPGRTTKALTHYVDLLPTLVEIAVGDIEKLTHEVGAEPLDGKSLLPLIRDKRATHHEAVFGFCSWGVMQAYPMRSIRTATHKFIWNIDSHFQYPTEWGLELPHNGYPTMQKLWQSWLRQAKTDPFAAERVRAEMIRPPEELYDIRSDPHEMRNLAEDPAQRELMDDLRARLKAWMHAQGDEGDSAYHLEKGKRRFLDDIYCRQWVVNIKLFPQGLSGGVNDTSRVELTSPLWAAELYYTLDGQEPTRASKRYTEPFMIDPPCTIRARGFHPLGDTPIAEVEYHPVDFRFLYERTHYKPFFWP